MKITLNGIIEKLTFYEDGEARIETTDGNTFDIDKSDVKKVDRKMVGKEVEITLTTKE